MKTAAVATDHYSYLTESYDKSNNVNNILASNMNQTSSSVTEEEGRKQVNEEAQRLLSFADSAAKNKSNSFQRREQQQESYLQKPSSNEEQPLPLPNEPMGPMPNLESFIDQPTMNVNMNIEEQTMPIMNNMNIEEQTMPTMNVNMNIEEQPLYTEVNIFEASIIQNIQPNQTFILQDFIQNSEIPESCKRMQQPRKFYAGKVFSAVLNLAGQRKVKVSQEKPYANIKVTLN